MQIRTASPKDAQPITDLINLAFEVERPFMQGDRIAIEDVQRRIDIGKFFLAEDDAGIAGCVYIELQNDRSYLGLLSIDPARQGTGLGKKLMSIAEQYARDHGSRAMDLLILNLRTELPPFYLRLGYAEDGTAPFPDNGRQRQPCHFIKMSKPLIPEARF